MQCQNFRQDYLQSLLSYNCSGLLHPGHHKGMIVEEEQHWWMVSPWNGIFRVWEFECDGSGHLYVKMKRLNCSSKVPLFYWSSIVVVVRKDGNLIRFNLFPSRFSLHSLESRRNRPEHGPENIKQQTESKIVFFFFQNILTLKAAHKESEFPWQFNLILA